VHRGQRASWNTSRPGDTVVITLAGQRAAGAHGGNPHRLVDRINAAVAARP
jgi:hypothetical protein